jgi:hypothetical protein
VEILVSLFAIPQPDTLPKRFGLFHFGKSARTTMILAGAGCAAVSLETIRAAVLQRMQNVTDHFQLIQLRLDFAGLPMLDIRWAILPLSPADHALHAADDDDDEADADDMDVDDPKATTKNNEDKDRDSTTLTMMSWLRGRTSVNRKAGVVPRLKRLWRFFGMRDRRQRAREQRVHQFNLVFPVELARELRSSLNLPAHHEAQLQSVLLFVRSFQGSKTPLKLKLTTSARVEQHRQMVEIQVEGLRELDVDEVMDVLRFIRNQQAWDDVSTSYVIARSVLSFSMHPRLQ